MDKKTNKADRRFFTLRSYLAFFISLGAGAALCAIIIVIDYYSNGFPNFSKFLYHFLSDGFGISGIFLILAYLLHLVSLAGTFDMLTYSVKLLFLNAFRPRYRKEKFPANFYEYKMLKRENKQRSTLEILFAGLIYLVLGIIFLALYNANPIG